MWAEKLGQFGKSPARLAFDGEADEAIENLGPEAILCGFDHDLARVMREPLLVFDIPSQRLEEGRDEINAGLGLGIAFGQVVGSVGFEPPYQFLKRRLEGVQGNRQMPLLLNCDVQ
jgi:hypothetical protein